MKTLVRSSICRYWETMELPLNEETIQEVNELIAECTNGTAPVVTEEEIVQCHSGDYVGEYLEEEYEYYGNQMWLCDIVSGILDQLFSEIEGEYSLMKPD